MPGREPLRKEILFQPGFPFPMAIVSVPFPEVPPALRERFELGELTLCGLGACRHGLDLDFFEPDRALLATRILEVCTRDGEGGKVPGEFFWALPLGIRLACLLEIASADLAQPPTKGLRCAADGCGAMIEVTPPLDEIAALQRRVGPRESVSVEVGSRWLSVRLPTGADQRAWLWDGNADDAPDLPRILRRLTADLDMPEMTPEQLAQIEAALTEADPLVDFSIRATCPECGRETEYPVDLQELVLRLVQEKQQALLAAVHKLAVAYHWPEHAIVEMPAWRRNHYLQLVEMGAA